MVSASDGSARSFFDLLMSRLEEYTESRNGQFTISCSTKRDGGSEFYNLEFDGYCADPFCFSPEHLESYLSWRERNNRIRNNIVFSFSEDKIVNILRETGYGGVNFAFDRGRNNQLILLCQSTISYRMILNLRKSTLS